MGVKHLGGWRAGRVLWEYADNGRMRALVRVETGDGLVVRQLHWQDELLRGGKVLELPLRAARQGSGPGGSRPD